MIYPMPNTATISSGRPTRVLLVGGHSSEVTAITGLDPHQYELHATGSGRQALDLMDNWSPDLMVVEAALPDVSGYDLCAALKRERSTRRIRVLIAANSGSLLPRVLAGTAHADGIVAARDADQLSASLASELASRPGVRVA
jgi:PleD family two-component response regulator